MQPVSPELRSAMKELAKDIAAEFASRQFSPRIRMLTIDQVCAVTGLAPSTIWDYVAKGKFPKPQEGVGKSLWREQRIIDWAERNDPNRDAA